MINYVNLWRSSQEGGCLLIGLSNVHDVRTSNVDNVSKSNCLEEKIVSRGDAEARRRGNAFSRKERQAGKERGSTEHTEHTKAAGGALGTAHLTQDH
jgi:hypothetical protein